MSNQPRQQRTIADVAEVRGFGFLSGRDVRVQFRPAGVDTGIVFLRDDLSPPKPIKAAVENRIDAPRRTTLVRHGASVEMVEHIMAALAGLRIDNCEIRANSVEMPGCDGSSQPLVEALDRAGIVVQDSLRPWLVVNDVTRVGDEKSWLEARPAHHGGMSLKYRLDYGGNAAIGRQTIEITVTPESFRKELASSRTFLLKEEVQWFWDHGLGRRAGHSDLLVFDDDGPVENELRFDDECVRHKALDLVGDLALAGCDLIGHFVAYRSGHRLNGQLVRALLREGQVREGQVSEGWRRLA